MKRQKKSITLDNSYDPIPHQNTCTIGDTIIIVREYFKKEGPTVSKLLENVISYEGKRMEGEKRATTNKTEY